MSAKTKIVVLHMKELIYTGIFTVLGILFIVLLIMMFLPGNEDEKTSPDSTQTTTLDTAETTALYTAGVYTTQLILGEQSLDVEVIVDKTSIVSIRMINLDEAVTTMYPLLQPAFDSICEQVYELQTLEGITYSTDSKYTSLVLLEAIQNSLNKALIPEVE